MLYFFLFTSLVSFLMTFLSLFPLRFKDGWFLVPIFAPFIGAIIGTMIYQLMVGFHVEGEVREREENKNKEENLQLNINSNPKSNYNGKEANC